MIWFLPIGVYEGIQLTSQIPDSTVDLTEDGETEHSVIRTAAGAVPLPPEYGDVLGFLSSQAPADVYLSQWFAERPTPDVFVKQFEELAASGLVMSFGERPLTDETVAARVITKVGEIRRIQDDDADSSNLETIEAGDDSEVSVNKWLLDLVERVNVTPTTVTALFRAFGDALPSTEKPYADQIFESGLQALVQSGAVQVVTPD